MTNNISEKDLIQNAKNNPEEFGKIFDIYYRQILGYTIRRTANIEVARDITSEVFLKALKNIDRFKWQGTSISSWLYRIASNEVVDFFRKKKYKPYSLDELHEVAGFDPADATDLKEELIQAEREIEQNEEFLQAQRALTQLPVHYQEALALRYFEEKSIKEISAILQKKEGTVKSLLSRGIQLLRKEMQKQGLQPKIN